VNKQAYRLARGKSLGSKHGRREGRQVFKVIIKMSRDSAEAAGGLIVYAQPPE
jgi:hypothetical protein